MNTIVLKLSNDQAEALSQFVKRVCLSDLRQQATSDYEADLMQESMIIIQRELAESGFNPR